MGVGNIFVATTLAPLVVVLAAVSLQLLKIGLEQISKRECELRGCLVSNLSSASDFEIERSKRLCTHHGSRSHLTLQSIWIAVCCLPLGKNAK